MVSVGVVEVLDDGLPPCMGWFDMYGDDDTGGVEEYMWV